ncbi:MULTISPECIES: hypothetical protein [unclassified Roseitalea]|uniref:hypothetical protein n=1 Tax=unclassified Roseitalea TaxID=2639107 RepID=UPI00273F7CDA|nr:MULTISPECIES: hypothetical protein [unclassified Roseitalea]
MEYGDFDDIREDERAEFGKSISCTFEASARNVVHVDFKKYQHWLDKSDLNEDQKQEFLEAIWSVVVSFVDLGFEVHPLQEACGQKSQSGNETPSDSFNHVVSDQLTDGNIELNSKLRHDEEET